MNRCAMCDLPMHRYGFPDDGQGHEPTYVACINSLRGDLDEAERFIERCARDHKGRRRILPWYVAEARRLLARRTR